MKHLKYFESVTIEKKLSLREYLTLYLEDAKVYFYHKKPLSIDKVENPQAFIDEYVDTAKRNNQWIAQQITDYEAKQKLIKAIAIEAENKLAYTN